MTDRAESGRRTGPARRDSLLRDCVICCNQRNVPGVVATVIPEPDLLVAPDPNGPIAPTGKPKPELRDELRRIPTLATS